MDEFLTLKRLLHPSSRHLAHTVFPRIREGSLSLKEGHEHEAAWDRWVLAQGDFLAVSAQLAEYVQPGWSCADGESAQDFWKGKLSHWPELARLATAVLNIPYSSAAVETVCSMVTQMELEKNRSLLAGENFLTELKLRANSALVEEMCASLAERAGSAMLPGHKRSRDM